MLRNSLFLLFLLTASLTAEVTVFDEKTPAIYDDPIIALQTLAGSTKLSIRGSAEREVLSVINYLPIGYLYHFYGNYSVINPDIVENIELYRSNFSPKYGNSMGAVIDISRKDVVDSKIRLNGFSGSVATGGGSENFTFSISGRKSLTETYFQREVRDRVKFSDLPDFYDYYYSLNLEIGRGDISIEGLGAGDSYRLYSSEKESFDPLATGYLDESRSFQTTGVRWRYFGDRGESETLLYQNRELNSQNFFQNSIELDTTQDGFFHISTFRGNNRRTSFGLEYINWTIPISMNSVAPEMPDDIAYRQNGEERFIINRDIGVSQSAVFLEDWFRGRNWRVLYGFRFIKDSYGIKDQNINPRLQLNYVWDTLGSEIIFSAGRYSQMVNGLKLIEEFGNPLLQYEHSIHYLFTLKKSFTDETDLKFNIYHKSFTDLSIRDEVENYITAGTGYVTGFELELKKEIFGLKVDSSYSYLESKREISRGSGLQTFYKEVPHSLKLKVLKEFKNYYISLYSLYESGEPYSTLSEDGEIDTPFGERLPNRFELNLKFGFSKDEWSGSFEVMNITDNRNVRSILYNGSYQEFYIYDRGITPWFNLEYRF